MIWIVKTKGFETPKMMIGEAKEFQNKLLKDGLHSFIWRAK